MDGNKTLDLLAQIPEANRKSVEAFLAHMPKEYIESCAPEEVRSHWAYLTTAGFLDERDEKTGHKTKDGGLSTREVLMFQKGERTWLVGRYEGGSLLEVCQPLVGTSKAWEFTAFFDREGRFVVCNACPMPSSGNGGVALIDEAKSLVSHWEKNKATRPKPKVSTEGEKVSFICANTDTTTVLRNVIESVSRLNLRLAFFQLKGSNALSSLPNDKKVRYGRTVLKEIRVGWLRFWEAQKGMLEELTRELALYLQPRLEVRSLFDIVGPKMVGPSSSHTAGACLIGNLARHTLMAMKEAGYFARVKSVKVVLWGSFRDTGFGHKTHLAVVAGLNGAEPDSPDMRQKGSLKTGDPIQLGEAGSPQFGGVFLGPSHLYDEYLEKDCNNVAEIVAEVEGGASPIVSVVGYSLGGGIAEVRRVNGLSLNPPIDGNKDLSFPSPSGTKAGKSSQAEISLILGKAEKGWIPKVSSGAPPAEDIALPYNTFEEVLSLCEKDGKSILRLALELEGLIRSRTEKEVYSLMEDRWRVMKQAILDGIRTKEPLLATCGNNAELLWRWALRKHPPEFIDLAIAMAVAANETNANMGLIVACPTAGACGVVPGVLGAWDYLNPWQEQRVVEALIVAAFIGMILYDDVPTAGALLGCQAEVGVGAAMAASALAYLEGRGSENAFAEAETIVHAATLALKNSMGLVCDPVAGLVEVPCIKRNGIFAAVAIAAARMALSGVRSAISPDEVVLAVRDVGERLAPEFKETALGGLATTRDGEEVRQRISKQASEILRYLQERTEPSVPKGRACVT